MFYFCSRRDLWKYLNNETSLFTVIGLSSHVFHVQKRWRKRDSNFLFLKFQFFSIVQMDKCMIRTFYYPAWIGKQGRPFVSPDPLRLLFINTFCPCFYSQSSSPLQIVQHSCKCRTRCATRKCPCKREGVLCGQYCHPGKGCCNGSCMDGTKSGKQFMSDLASGRCCDPQLLGRNQTWSVFTTSLHWCIFCA